MQMIRKKVSRIKTISEWTKDDGQLERIWRKVLNHYNNEGKENALNFLDSEAIKYEYLIKKEMEGTNFGYSMPCKLAMKQHVEYLDGLEKDKQLVENILQAASEIENDTVKNDFLIDAKFENYHKLISTTPNEWEKMLLDSVSKSKENEKDTLGLNKKLKWQGKSISLITLFYDLYDLELMKGNKTDIERLICGGFITFEGKEFSKEYIKKNLKPEGMRASNRANFVEWLEKKLEEN